MEGAFGSFLHLCDALGLVVQRFVKMVLIVLIGSSAKNWSLVTLAPIDRNFKDQRLIRELLGFPLIVAIACVIVRVALSDYVPTTVLVLVAVFAISRLARSILERDVS